MQVQRIFEIVERDKQLGRVDRNSIIGFINDALHEINESNSKTYSELIEDFDEQFITLSRKAIKIKNVHIGQNEKFAKINKMRHDSRSITKFEE